MDGGYSRKRVRDWQVSSSQGFDALRACAEKLIRAPRAEGGPEGPWVAFIFLLTASTLLLVGSETSSEDGGRDDPNRALPWRGEVLLGTF